MLYYNIFWGTLSISSCFCFHIYVFQFSRTTSECVSSVMKESVACNLICFPVFGDRLDVVIVVVVGVGELLGIRRKNRRCCCSVGKTMKDFFK